MPELSIFHNEYIESGKKWFVLPRFGQEFEASGRKLPEYIKILSCESRLDETRVQPACDEIMAEIGHSGSEEWIKMRKTDLPGLVEAGYVIYGSDDISEEALRNGTYFLTGNMNFLRRTLLIPARAHIVEKWVNLYGLEHLPPVKSIDADANVKIVLPLYDPETGDYRMP